MQEEKTDSSRAILSRLRQQLKIHSDIELSEILEVRPSTLSTWKKRNSLNYPLVLDLCKKHGIDLELLFFGEKKTRGPYDFSFETPWEPRYIVKES